MAMLVYQRVILLCHFYSRDHLTPNVMTIGFGAHHVGHPTAFLTDRVLAKYCYS